MHRKILLPLLVLLVSSSICQEFLEGAQNQVESFRNEISQECPENCVSFYDGCNTCGCSEGRITFCTKMFCPEPNESKCLQYKQDLEDCPADCQVWNDGCNYCQCKEGKIQGCTKMYCEVKSEPKCVKSIGNEDEYSKRDKCPLDCSSWFDGCNNCRCSEGKILGCTRKHCQTYQEARCLQ